MGISTKDESTQTESHVYESILVGSSGEKKDVSIYETGKGTDCENVVNNEKRKWCVRWCIRC